MAVSRAPAIHPPGANHLSRHQDVFGSAPIRETEKWLNRIETRANTGSLDVAELRSLIGAWREIIEVGRESFNLVDAPERVRL